MEIKQIKIKSNIILSKLKGHNKINKDLLKFIYEAPNESLSYKDEYYNYSINKLDYSKCGLEDRPWIKILLPYLQDHFNKCAKHLGFVNCIIRDLWFQQYEKGNSHEWHTHGRNYTGVYYLELPKQSPLTELVDPTNFNKKFKIKAKEGDIVIFPSFVIHRSGKVLTNIRKTIISFNLDFDHINKDTLKKLKK
jgi:hypothetical protein